MNESTYAAGERHRCVDAETLEFHPFPDSIFQHIQSCYGEDCDAIHRCFSLARLYKAQMYVEERIPAIGQLQEDIHEFVYSGHPGGDVRQVGEAFVKKVSEKPCDSAYVSLEKGYLEFKAQRISFWKENLLDRKQEDRAAALAELGDAGCIGYVILVKAGCVKGKLDKIREREKDRRSCFERRGRDKQNDSRGDLDQVAESVFAPSNGTGRKR